MQCYNLREPTFPELRLERWTTAIYGYHMPEPTKTTVYLDPVDYRRLKALAKSQGRPTAELVREAVSEYASRHATPVQPSSIGAGRSGRGDLSERAESLLEGMGERA